MVETFIWYNICAASVSWVAFGSNLGSQLYIQRTFDTNLSLYHILSLDSKVVMVSTIIFQSWFLINFIDYECEKISCAFLFLGSTITVLTSPLCNFMVSYIRYKRVSYSKVGLLFWKSEKELVRKSTWIIGLVLLYGLILTFINAYFNLRAFNIYSVCLEKQHTTNNQVSFCLITVLIPMMILFLTTCIMDFLCYIWINDIPNKRYTNDIPLRATLISTALLFPYLISTVVLAMNDINALDKYLIAIISYRFNDIIRSPLTATCTFRINNENMQRNADLERERKRQIEIQDALQRRSERRQPNIAIVQQVYHQQ